MKKKIISLLMSLTLLAGATPTSFADEIQTPPYTLWNYFLIESGSEELYEDFPVAIDKIRQANFQMDLTMQYLKNPTEASDISIEIIDMSNNQTVISKDITIGDTLLYFENIDNNKIYKVIISEDIGGESRTYTKYIETKLNSADFPINIQLGDNIIENNNGETFDNIMYKKVLMNEGASTDNYSPLAETETSAEDETASNNRHKILLPEDFDGFYDSLDANSFYELQMTASTDSETARYQGYISTFPNGDDMGIFTRIYSLRDTLQQQASTTFIDSGISTMSANMTLSELEDAAVEYQYYRNYFIRFDECYEERVYHFVPEETGEYIFETIGNDSTRIDIYEVDNGVFQSEPHSSTSGGTGQNARKTLEYYIEEDTSELELYIVVTRISGSSDSIFRIIKGEGGRVDDFTNYYDEIIADANNGTYSNYKNSGCYLNYGGDVDLFAYDVQSGYGYIHLADKDNGDVNTGEQNWDVKLNVYEMGDAFGLDYDSYWIENTVTSLDLDLGNFDSINDEIYQNTDYEPTRLQFITGKYLFEVLQSQSTMPSYGTTALQHHEYYIDALNTCEYAMNFYYPTEMDSYEAAINSTYGNNAPMFASTLNFTNGTQVIPNLTIDKGDKDYFGFTTGSAGGSVTVTVDCTDIPYVYSPTLYDSDEISSEVREDGTLVTSGINNIANTVINGKVATFTYDNLTPNHTYYIRVTRINSADYSPYHLYDLSVTFNIPQTPTATIDNNIVLSHTVGNNITSIDTFLTTVMQNLTCKLNDVEVADNVAQSDVVLYYNDTALTADTVNQLTAGTYTLTAKYQNVLATGGTITLNVSNASVNEDIVELENIDKVYAGRDYFDWVASAQMIANVRLLREGLSVSSTTITSVARAIKGSDYKTRGTLAETAEAANYIYSQTTGEETIDFDSDTIPAADLEDELYFMIDNNMGAIVQLTNTSAPTDMSQARYLFISGVNATTHMVKVMDSAISADGGVTSTWIPISDLTTTGYNGNSSLIYSGCVIDFSF